MKALGHLYPTKPALFVDGLDFLLAAGDENITANDILTLLANLSEVISILDNVDSIANLADLHLTIRRSQSPRPIAADNTNKKSINTSHSPHPPSPFCCESSSASDGYSKGRHRRNSHNEGGCTVRY